MDVNSKTLTTLVIKIDLPANSSPSLGSHLPFHSASHTLPDKCPQMISYYFAMQQLFHLGCSMSNYAMSFLIIMEFCHLK